MPNSQSQTSTSASTNPPPNPPPEATIAEADAEATSNGAAPAAPAATESGDFVPPDAGRRIPIPIRPMQAPAGNGATANGPTVATHSNGAAQPAQPSPFRGFAPDVMSEDQPPQPAQAAQAPVAPTETVEARVQRLRPRSLAMQVRFLRTLFFMLYLFGRLIFWQVLVASYFPKLVARGNNKRWRKYARQFRNFAIRMGGVMIKAGQFASTRADVLPEEVIAELAGLQDKVPTIQFKKIESVIVRELGDIKQRFEWVQAEPIAAASLGQVHRAKLKTGEGVVIKVQRPGIREVVYTDMAALFIVARVAMRFGFIRKRADAVLVAEEFGSVLLEEISYTHELGNGARFYEMFRDVEGVYIPRMYPQHSTDFVLTIEDVTNIKLNDYAAMDAAGIDRKEVATRLMDTYMLQIFEERFFHADPHPGNLFVRPLPVAKEAQYVGKGGRPFELIYIDFGMTGSLTREIRQGLIDTLAAVITRDASKLVASYQALGFLLPGADTKRVEEATTLVFDQVWGMSMKDMGSMDFDKVSEIGREFSELLYDMPFRVPQDFVYLGRSVAILTGMCTALDPEYNPWSQMQFYTRQLITTGDDGEGNLLTELQKAFLDPLLPYFTNGPQGVILALRELLDFVQTPQRTERLLKQVISGEVAIVSKPSTQYRRQLDRIEAQGRRSSRMFLFGSVLITSTLLYTNGDTSLAAVGYGFSALIFLTLWFIRS